MAGKDTGKNTGTVTKAPSAPTEEYNLMNGKMLNSPAGILHNVGDVRYDKAPYDRAMLECREDDGRKQNESKMSKILSEPGARDAVIALHNNLYPKGLFGDVGSNVPKHTAESSEILAPIAKLCDIAKKPAKKPAKDLESPSR